MLRALGFFRGVAERLPEDAVDAWGVMMKAFPGSFPWDAFDRLPLDRYGEAYALAVECLEAEAEAIRAANKG
ncbi:Rhodospirillum photometricum DSM 122 draft genome sequence (modular protein) [uncultured Alphaproteobacteria bacterium]|uniref:Rhodospirillum photometricum DSM 122 draft genome sequence (Modular protein) n=1 Tax=uncultured Alphaproteobacteria bacterium TaxID=91750 RepID=A0A212J3X5_9PROT|nr:Rhodospirillum photometricum DSM 122 draft genome sequence (modular protein) [uncultured Alphaproteobacteria bacterium]